jgi:hypothetical protein
MPLVRALLIAALLISATASGVVAQSADSARAGMRRMNLISTNPIGIIFEWYNAEFEHAIASTASIAVAGSHFDFDNFTYNQVDGIVRYYPSAEALKGFSFGGSAGYLSAKDSDCIDCVDLTAFTLGVRGDYVWIMGRDQHFSVATGFGAKRVFYKESGTSASTALPIARLSVGWAF